MRTCHNCQNLRTLILFPVTRVSWSHRKACLYSKSRRNGQYTFPWGQTPLLS